MSTMLLNAFGEIEEKEARKFPAAPALHDFFILISRQHSNSQNGTLHNKVNGAQLSHTLTHGSL